MILIVEDSSIQRMKLKKLLGTQGFEVSEAVHGAAALELLQDVPDQYDLILTDLLMPEMDGVRFLEELKAQNIGIPVVIISADIQDSTKQRCMDLGAIAFLNKPVQQETLLPIIAEIVSK